MQLDMSTDRPMAPYTLSHVTLVVESLETTARRLERVSPRLGPVENRPSEGTREQYLGPEGGSALLLLCEPTDPAGPYARAMARRGPGLHHIGLSVPKLDDYLAGLAGSGWYLMPQSVKWIARGSAWLARPGVHVLVELCEMAEAGSPAFITDIEIPMLLPEKRLIARLGLPGRPLRGVSAVPAGPSCLTVAGRRFDVKDLARK